MGKQWFGRAGTGPWGGGLHLHTLLPWVLFLLTFVLPSSAPQTRAPGFPLPVLACPLFLLCTPYHLIGSPCSFSAARSAEGRGGRYLVLFLSPLQGLCAPRRPSQVRTPSFPRRSSPSAQDPARAGTASWPSPREYEAVVHLQPQAGPRCSPGPPGTALPTLLLRGVLPEAHTHFSCCI